MATELEDATAAIEALVAAIAALDVIDLSPVLGPDVPRFATHPEIQIVERTRTIPLHGFGMQTLILPEHVGPHVDAPAHVLADRPEATVDTLAPTALWGRAVKVDLSGRDLQAGELVDVDELLDAAGAAIREGDVVLIDFGWSRHLQPGGRGAAWWGLNTPGLTERACRALRDLGVRAVCSDSSTCDCSVVDGEMVAAYGHAEHFLPNDISIVECLDGLARVPAISYFAATPLRILHGSGSPLRPIALVPRG